MKRIKFIVNGRVQGVGFRPFVFRLATEHGLAGQVSNNELGVVIEVQGPGPSLEKFRSSLTTRQPPLAEITHVRTIDLEPAAGAEGFFITPSSGQGEHQVLISPDAAICPDCEQELLNPRDRRFLYPFINCTNCGPRLTITRSIPYDRPMTSMACFAMCQDCLAEYNDPMDRRFHAQPNACVRCGPEVWLTDKQGNQLVKGDQAISMAARAIQAGKIVAAKGLGGFHLICDACQDHSVQELRTRKNRPDKSLAVMVADLDTARKVGHIDQEQEKLLTSPARPIIILTRKFETVLSSSLSPDTSTLGIMLPYTPLHMILFYHLKELAPSDLIQALVMTSGNFSSEPISLGNREALNRLEPIADLFLLHNRDILIRCDDSVLSASQAGTHFFRRARGYTPSPVFLSSQGPSILGTGPELKNTICLTKKDQAFVSQHIGDLKNLETYDFFLETISHFQDILKTRPQAVVCDLHPDYLSSRYARDESGLPVFTLQHHFAHIFSVMAENRHDGPCLGLAIDGTGLGPDRTLWGGELLVVDNTLPSMERLGSFSPVALPGGEKAIEEPWRIALSFLHQLGALDQDFLPWQKKFKNQEIIVRKMLNQNINAPLSTGCGRLFDAVSALLGLVESINYEGQGAIILEKIQDFSDQTVYPVEVSDQDGLLVLDTLGLFSRVLDDLRSGTSPEKISRRFHLSLAHGICKWASMAARQTGIKTLGLSGGVLQNITLHNLLWTGLQSRGFKVLTHRLLPPSDACISLGQAVYGRIMLKK
ncbi:carbamoyltransferase HypF [Desulfonatronovibrio hydrogenovorans]|uniref:carbamoyltransferase HypF n=1 Tax=Desulfonatronovibrio hydrogenovorans TaxID=53245 RepID=UPI00048AD51C|nr:carbamoyltransferase HypF [Desulfonatronovibrio hydrogenovorans]